MTKKYIIISTCLFMLVVSGLVGKFIFEKKQTKNISLGETSSQNQIQEGEGDEENIGEDVPMITSDIDTSDWQTYRNEEFGFEFKYPDGWSVEEYKKGEPIRDSIASDYFVGLYDDKSSFVMFVTINRLSESEISNFIEDVRDTTIFEKDMKEGWQVKKVKINNIVTKLSVSSTYNRTFIPFLNEGTMHNIAFTKSIEDLKKNDSKLALELLAIVSNYKFNKTNKEE